MNAQRALIVLTVAVLSLARPASSAAYAQGVAASSKITQVTVYPDSAQVTRTATVKLGQGENSVVFPALVPDFDERSLRASADKDSVAIADVKVEKTYLDESASERVKKLKDELEMLQDRQKELEHVQQALSERKQFLDSVRLFARDQIPEDLVTKVPSRQQLSETLEFLSQGLADYFRSREQVEKDARSLARTVEAVRQQLAQVSGGAGTMTRSIVVTVNAPEETSAQIAVSYLVSGASWQPAYDARADFEAQKVELTLLGLVSQKTGEEWDAVALSFSTAQPAIGGRLPYVAPWFLRPLEAKRDALMKARAGGAPALQYSAMERDEAGAAAEPPAAPLSSSVEKGVAVVYTLTSRVTVASDGAAHKFAVSSQSLKADFTYTSYPRASRYAYLGSRVTNGPDQQLLAGPVHLFLDGDFVGQSSIDTIGGGEEFDLYLGADENVKVKRELVAKKVDETLIGGIPAPNKKTAFTYKVTIENYKGRRISMRLFDALPVSEDDRIKVKIAKVSPEPSRKDYEDRKGVWLWETQLDPKKKQEIEYHFSVEHPRDMSVEGL